MHTSLLLEPYLHKEVPIENGRLVSFLRIYKSSLIINNYIDYTIQMWLYNTKMSYSTIIFICEIGNCSDTCLL